MASFAEGLAAREVATLRFQFPYMEKGSKRIDPPRGRPGRGACRGRRGGAAAAGPAALRRRPLVRRPDDVAGAGRRRRCPACAASSSSASRSIRPAGPAPSAPRTSRRSSIPMLFLQGTRDELATLDLLNPVVDGLGPNATLELFDDADHSFHVRARSGRNDAAGARGDARRHRGLDGDDRLAAHLESVPPRRRASCAGGGAIRYLREADCRARRRRRRCRPRHVPRHRKSHERVPLSPCRRPGGLVLRGRRRGARARRLLRGADRPAHRAALSDAVARVGRRLGLLGAGADAGGRAAAAAAVAGRTCASIRSTPRPTGAGC